MRGVSPRGRRKRRKGKVGEEEANEAEVKLVEEVKSWWGRRR